VILGYYCESCMCVAVLSAVQAWIEEKAWIEENILVVRIANHHSCEPPRISVAVGLHTGS